jgi:uncharacterized protein YjbJ (UPF0337 family)
MAECEPHRNIVPTAWSRAIDRRASSLNLSAMSQALSPGDFAMDHNRVEGTKHQIKGTAKEVVGKVTGNKAKEVAGKLEKNVGKIQKEVGKAADEQRDANKHQH